MYKPPQNTNRVQSLRSKFENLEDSKVEPEKINGNRNYLNNNPKTDIHKENPIFERQTSDPSRRHIKRTPAFRVEKSVAENSELQRTCLNKTMLFENKIKQYSVVKNSLDALNNCQKTENNVSENEETLAKSQFSSDFHTLCKMFDNFTVHVAEGTFQKNNCMPCERHIIDDRSGVLYTEPIPKALRNKTLMQNSVLDNRPDAYNVSCRQGIFNNENSVDSQFVTNTLKTALKKPLPLGPAPKKPPRTFQHNQIKSDMSVSPSYLINNNGVHSNSKLQQKKTDPKYMLTKLETALKNNKLRAKKQYKTDISTTSGEDSDDSLLFKSKTTKIEPKPTSQCSDNVSASSFNCLSIINCSSSEYEEINQKSSIFFTDCPEDPIYVEPYHYLKDGVSNLKNERKSL